MRFLRDLPNLLPLYPARSWAFLLSFHMCCSIATAQAKWSGHKLGLVFHTLSNRRAKCKEKEEEVEEAVFSNLGITSRRRLAYSNHQHHHHHHHQPLLFTSSSSSSSTKAWNASLLWTTSWELSGTIPPLCRRRLAS